MSISGISSSILSQLTATANSSTDPMQQAWKDLESAIESGDLESAKTAFETIQKLHAEQVSKDSASGRTVDTSEMDSAMEALGEALESGDLTSVQEAFATVQSKMKQAPPPPDKTSAASSEAYVLELLESLDTSNSSNDSTDISSLYDLGRLS